jgi:hypothetical protein
VVLYLLKYKDKGSITTVRGVITLLQEIGAGITLGVLAVSTFVFLDHKDVMHLQSMHKYCMRDLKTRWNVKESPGLKFMESDGYQKKIAEINSLPTKITYLDEKVRKYLKHAAIKPGHDVLALGGMLGLG